MTDANIASMASQSIRQPAVAGSWYPLEKTALAAEVDRYLSVVPQASRGRPAALIAPHAGLKYSGPVAAYAYASLVDYSFDVVVLLGPSHRIGFDGVAIYARGGFATPLGVSPIDEQLASAIMETAALVREDVTVHAKEHSLEMQLPFLQRVQPGTPIVPLLMGYQTRSTVDRLSAALAAILTDRATLLIASSDLSHYHSSEVASSLDGEVIQHVSRFDFEGLQSALEKFPDHACGGGPMVAVMKTARALGATEAMVLNYADSGDISGDKSAVVGYLAAAFGGTS